MAKSYEYNFQRTAPRNLRKWNGGIVLKDPQTFTRYEIQFVEAETGDNSPSVEITSLIDNISPDTSNEPVIRRVALTDNNCDGDIRAAASIALKILGRTEDHLRQLEYVSSFPENFAFCPHLTDDIDGNGVCEFGGIECHGCTLGRSYRDDP